MTAITLRHFYEKDGRLLPAISQAQACKELEMTRQGLYYHVKHNGFPKGFRLDNMTYYDAGEVEGWKATRRR